MLTHSKTTLHISLDQKYKTISNLEPQAKERLIFFISKNVSILKSWCQLHCQSPREKPHTFALMYDRQ